MVYNRGKTHTTHISNGEQCLSVESMDDSSKGASQPGDNIAGALAQLSMEHSDLELEVDGIHSSNDLASGGECEDPEDINSPNYTDPLGNDQIYKLVK